MSNFSNTAILTFLGYILLYGVCWGTDKTDIEKYKKKIKLNKYTSILFFLWSRNEKVYWLIYIIIITESVAFILVWIAYLLNIVFLYKIFYTFSLPTGSIIAEDNKAKIKRVEVLDKHFYKLTLGLDHIFAKVVPPFL